MHTKSFLRLRLTFSFLSVSLGIGAMACQCTPFETDAPVAEQKTELAPPHADNDRRLVRQIDVSSAPDTPSEENEALDPIDTPLDAFCDGTGPWVQLGSHARVCLGDLAESTFRFGLCSCSSLMLGGALRSDSYSSALGPYGTALEDENDFNVGKDGHIGVVGVSELDKKIEVAGSLYSGAASGIQLGPDSEILGNFHSEGPALASSHTHVRIGRNAFIRGEVAPKYQVEGTLYVPPEVNLPAEPNAAEVVRADFPQMVPCTCNEPDGRMDIAAIIETVSTRNDNRVLEDIWSERVDAGAESDLRIEDMWTGSQAASPRELTIPCGRYYFREIVQPQHIRIEVEGRAALFVDGDFRVSGLTLGIAEGAELDLFIRGDFVVQSAVALSSSVHAAGLRYYIQGNIELEASSELVGNFYAPNAHFQTNGATRVFGAVLAKQITLGAGTEIHFDSAVREQGALCPSEVPILREEDDATGHRDGGAAAPCVDGCRENGEEVETCVPFARLETAALEDEAVVNDCLVDTDCCAPGVCVEGFCTVFAG